MEVLQVPKIMILNLFTVMFHQGPSKAQLEHTKHQHLLIALD